MPAWLSFTLLRLGVFIGVFVVLLALRLDWLWAALIAAIIGLCVSFIFFRGQRAAMASEWATRAPRRGRDELAEDDVLDEHRVDESASGDRQSEHRSEP